MEEFKAFIVTSHYEIINDESYIVLFGRLENGKSFTSYQQYKPHFFIKETDSIKAKSILNLNITNVLEKTLLNNDLVKISVNNPKEISVLKRLFENENIVSYESDIQFTRKFFIDNNIKTSAIIKGKPNQGKFTDLEFTNPEIKTLDKKNISIKPTVFSFDIETDPKANFIHSIAIFTKDVKKVLVVKNDVFKITVPEHTTVFDNEKELLIEFMEIIKTIDPDIITGWNVIDFDLNVIHKRCSHYKINFNIGRTSNNSSLRIESSFLKSSSAQIQGRLVLDGIDLMKSSFIDLPNYKLETAAQHFLGTGKTCANENRIDFIEDTYYNHPEQFVKYNLTDAKLVYEILNVSNAYELTIQRSLLTGLHMNNVGGSIASFDNLYIPKLHNQNIIANSIYQHENMPTSGGFVMTSIPGLYDNILVLDFKSLYPSIMLTFNIDPISYTGHDSEDKDYSDIDKFIKAPNGAIFKNEDSILSNLISSLWKERDKAKLNNNKLSSYAIKIQMNSMYGVLATPRSRFFNTNISNAITNFGQFFIQKTIEKIEEIGFQVIYGDTDSVFINTATKDTNTALQIGKDIENKLNTFLAQYVKEKYGRTSRLELEFEKTYTKFFMPTIRDSKTGAKKRYAGLKLKQDNTTKIEFTGLEFVRKDWTDVSKRFQLTLFNLLFSDKPCDSFIKEFVSDIKKGKYDDLLIYRKSLTKDLDSYTKTTPPHVKAARLLDNVTSRQIEYVVTKDGPQPISKQTSKFDYDHYIEKQIKPIANSVLQVLNKEFDDVIKGSKQKGLGDFF